MREGIAIIISLFSMTYMFATNGDSLSKEVITEQEYIEIIKQYHPLSLQAKNVRLEGESLVRSARGYFDPKLYAQHLDKNFETKNYYDLTNIGLKIPTWFGVEVKSGWEYAFGSFTNPESSTPNDGLFYTGISISPNQLIIDKRKATLQKAKEYRKMSLHQQNEMLNDLFRDAIYEYWNWSAQYEKMKILEVTLANINTRMINSRTLFKYGELSTLDTLETSTQLKAIQVEVLNSQLQYQKVTLNINNFLWGDNLIPMEVNDLKPEVINPNRFESSVEQQNVLLTKHPTLNAYQNKLEALKINQRLQAQNLAPKLEFQYNVLRNGSRGLSTSYSLNNYKWGFNFSFPILLRKERGQLQLAKIATQQQELKIKLKQQTLRTKANSYLAMVKNLKKQQDTYQEAVTGYSKLLQQEQRKVESGESTFFKLTIRENKLYTSQLKYIDIQLKLIKSHLFYQHTIGQLYSL